MESSLETLSEDKSTYPGQISHCRQTASYAGRTEITAIQWLSGYGVSLTIKRFLLWRLKMDGFICPVLCWFSSYSA